MNNILISWLDAIDRKGYLEELVLKLQTENDRRLVLLMKIRANIVDMGLTCPICLEDGCSDNCELRKELSDG